MTRNMTLVEIVVASVILSMVSIVSMTLMNVLQRSNTVVAKNVEIATDARRIVGMIAKDVRQTGFAYDESTKTNYEYGPVETGSTSVLTLLGFGASTLGDTDNGDAPVLSFRKRTAFGDDLQEDWREFVEYQVVADGNFTNVQGTPNRYRLDRRIATDVDGNGAIDGTDPDITVTIARNLSRVSFARPDAGDSSTREDDLNIDIRIEFTRPSTRGAVDPGISVEYRERVRMANLPETRD